MGARAAEQPPRPAAARPRLGRRAIAAAPALGAGLVIFVFYLVEASLQKTPWVFTDELEWTQISRAIAATGHAARRGQPVFFKSLYAYLIAPAWWIHSTTTAYAAIKDIDTVAMCLAALPVYLLARMLVSRPVAATVAVGSIAIPAMSYATSIVPEPLAYLWFCLAAWLTVRALAAPRVATIVPAVVVAALGPLIEKEFVVLPIAGVLAAAILWVSHAGAGRSPRERLARTLAALAALAVFGFVFNALVVERIQEWSFSQYFDSHTLTAGALALGALTIGLGVLPVIGGLASLALPGRLDRPYRAYRAYLAASIIAIGIYTAAKVTYLAGATTLIEERNVFFLSPLLLLGTALALQARQLDWRVVGVATAVAVALVWSPQFEPVGAPYFEAPGLSILTFVNRKFIFTVADCRILLVCAATVGVEALALRSRRAVPLVAAILVGAWLVTGEVYATITNEEEANNVFAAALPPPRDWVDAATHGQPFAFLGQGPVDTTALWLTEFWNRGLNDVADVNGNAPGPGPTSSPALVSASGALDDYSGDAYTLAGPGVVLDARSVATKVIDGAPYTLYRTPGGWRLLKDDESVYPDGWQLQIGLYTYFVPGGPGTLRIDLSRTAYNGPGKAGRVTVTVGTVGLDVHGQPTIERVLAVRHAVVPIDHEVTLHIPVARTPVTIKVDVAPATLIHAQGDPRPLGVQVGFWVTRASHLASAPSRRRAGTRTALSSPP